MNSYSFSQVVFLTYSNFWAWGWRAGSSVLSDCQRTNHQATICYLSSVTRFSSQNRRRSFAETSGWSFQSSWLRQSTWCLLKIPIKMVLVPSESIHRDDTRCMCCTYAHTVQLCFEETKFWRKFCKFWRNNLKSGRRKLQLVFVNSE